MRGEIIYEYRRLNSEDQKAITGREVLDFRIVG